MPIDMKVSLVVKKTAKEAWATVKVMRIGDMCTKEANVQHLLKEFENITAMDGESIEDLMTRVTGLASNLQELGEKIEDKHIVRKLLRVILKRYNQIVCAIELFFDLNTMNVKELIGKLRAAEDRVTDEEVVAAGAGTERLLLTEEQWEARCRQRTGKNCTGHDINDDGSSTTSCATSTVVSGGTWRGTAMRRRSRRHSSSMWMMNRHCCEIGGRRVVV
jgi:hypothetical protein